MLRITLQTNIHSNLARERIIIIIMKFCIRLSWGRRARPDARAALWKLSGFDILKSTVIVSSKCQLCMILQKIYNSSPAPDYVNRWRKKHTNIRKTHCSEIKLWPRRSQTLFLTVKQTARGQKRNIKKARCLGHRDARYQKTHHLPFLPSTWFMSLSGSL